MSFRDINKPSDQHFQTKLYDLNEIDDLLQKSRDTHRDEYEAAMSQNKYQSPRQEKGATPMDQFQRIFIMSVEIDRLTSKLAYLEQNKKNILEMEKQIEGLTSTINHWRQTCFQKDEELDKLRQDYKDYHGLMNQNQDLQSEVIQLKNKFRYLQEQGQNKDSHDEINKLKKQNEELNDAHDEIMRLKKQNQELSKDSKAHDEVQKLKKQNQELQKLLEQFDQSHNDEINKIKKQNGELTNDAHDEIMRLKKQNQEPPKDTKALDEISKLKKQNQELQKLLESLDQSHHDEKNKLKKQNEQLNNETHDEIMRLKKQNSELSRDSKAHDEISKLKKQNQELSKILEQFDQMEKSLNQVKRQNQDLNEDIRKLQLQMMTEKQNNKNNDYQSPSSSDINYITQKLEDLHYKHNLLQRDYNDLRNQLEILPLQDVIYSDEDNEQLQAVIKHLQNQVSRTQNENQKLKDELYRHNRNHNSKVW